jgi:hypothetical protein
MRMLLRVFSAETLKLKRTIALRMVVVAPIAVVLLVLFLTANITTLLLNQRTDTWTSLTRLTLIFWAMLMLPLYVTLETALVAGVDHTENHWKILLARPVPRWTFYAVKLFIVAAMTGLSTLLVAFGIMAAGILLPLIQHDLHFGSPIPYLTILKKAAEVGGLAFLLLAIQHWVSLRWRSFTVPVAVGIVAMVIGYAMLFTAQRGSPGLAIYCPWSFPMLALLSPTANVSGLLFISGSLGIAVSAIGCWEFSRRDVE